ncbi:MAG: hypothetical protein HY294_12505 [Candidatus Rokubacteria bacterium]|nr:hypothetical protein [Candidatus Rokubacteria bacterium]MBI3826813.1 hypothetical protein [Candidatus Rokubacteria bacterium]
MTAEVVLFSVMVMFPDSCLGVAPPGVMCAQVLTPGTLQIVRKGDAIYERRCPASGDCRGDTLIGYARDGS